jgi:uncharacterized protein (TIGR03067 family)
MRVFRPFAFVLALCLVPQAAAEDKKPDADLKAMVGNWKIEKAELGGKDITEHIKDLKFEVRDGGKYTAELGEVKDDGTFTVDPAKSPKELDVKPTGGPNKGQTVKGIYKLDGDTLTICYDHEADKGKRPAKFETKPDTTLLLIVYKREKR